MTSSNNMNIEKMKTAPVISTPQKKLFDVCLELNQLAFPVSRRDDALYYLRPDMCIRQRDFDVIRGENSLAMTPNTQELVYIPTMNDLFHATPDLEQLTKTNSSGWFAYTNVQPEESAQLIKGNGATPWFALADAWIQIQKWKTGAELKIGDIIH